MKYQVLINILDSIREEATSQHQQRYLPPEIEIEKVNAARARAFVHLYLKVNFGLLSFDAREKYVTDGAYDGGLDAYYIANETKTIYLVQSKFRTSERNFENKEISLEEILVMDIDRILRGESCDENGNSYNGKIKQLQREISEIGDIGRYKYKVILLANLKDISIAKLKQLTGGFEVDVFDFEKSYEHLVFPVISGTYFTASDISIPIDLSNKNAGSKISYSVNTGIGECEITVLFVPTIEIARIMSKYKNSILKYNPRCYLEFAGQDVNDSIRNTILNVETNEFALFNNGITMLSSETYINERIGQKNKAQLVIKNPQIINGGQTSYTLSRIYEENGKDESKFNDKEVLLKIITLLDNSDHHLTLKLIDNISNATNKQTPVITADRFANESFHIRIQKKVFDRYGLMYERKRGEFSDGVHKNYIDKKDVIERNQFFRIWYSANGSVAKGSKKRLFQKNDFSDLSLENTLAFERFSLGFQVFKHLVSEKGLNNFDKACYGKIFAYITMFEHEGYSVKTDQIQNNLKIVEDAWTEFLEEAKVKYPKYLRHLSRRRWKSEDLFIEKYSNSSNYEREIQVFFAGQRNKLSC